MKYMYICTSYVLHVVHSVLRTVYIDAHFNCVHYEHINSQRLHDYIKPSDGQNDNTWNLISVLSQHAIGLYELGKFS